MDTIKMSFEEYGANEYRREQYGQWLHIHSEAEIKHYRMIDKKRTYYFDTAIYVSPIVEV